MAGMKLTVEIEKFNEGGYRATILAADGESPTIGCTSLPETMGWVAYKTGRVCGESPFLPVQREPYREPQVATPPALPTEEPSDPELVDKIAQRFSYNIHNGGRAAVAFIICATAALSTGMSWVA
jgi:hypothetical protein